MVGIVVRAQHHVEEQAGPPAQVAEKFRGGATGIPSRFERDCPAILEPEARDVECIGRGMLAQPAPPADVAAGVTAEMSDLRNAAAEMLPRERLKVVTVEKIEPQRDVAAHLLRPDPGAVELREGDGAASDAARPVRLFRQFCERHAGLAQGRGAGPGTDCPRRTAASSLSLAIEQRRPVAAFLVGVGIGAAVTVHTRVTHAGQTHPLYDRDTACGLERLSHPDTREWLKRIDSFMTPVPVSSQG